MARETRFECKYCSKPIYAPKDIGGKKIKCPHCKNPVTVPIAEFVEEESAPATGDQQAVKRKNPDRRPIQARHKFAFIKSSIKLVIAIVVLYYGYQVYLHFNKQSQKTVRELFTEYAEDEKLGNDVIIKQKLAKEDITVLREYRSSDKPAVRILIAECLAKIEAKDRFVILQKYLQDDKEAEVRAAAAAAFKNVRKKETVDLLVKQIRKESDPDVKGAIGKSLRSLTNQTGKSTNADYWEHWWNKNKNQFTIK